MTQQPTTCPQCHSSVQTGQPYCLACGAALAGRIPPTVYASPSGVDYGVNYGFSPPSPYEPNAAQPTPPPPPYNTGNPYAHYPPYGQPATPAPGAFPAAQGYGYAPPVPPPYAPPKKRSRAPLFIIGGLALVLVLIIGMCAYIGNIVSRATSHSTSTTSSISGGGSSSAAASSESLNLTAVYASDQITITSVQQAAQFTGDSNYSLKPNVVRVNFNEQQTAPHGSFYSYRTAFHLVLPDKTIVAVGQSKEYIAPEASVVRSNWVDFWLDSKVDLSKLVLRLGAEDEAQMNIPLTPGADLSQYKPKMSMPNTRTQYASINWTLESVTASLSSDGEQAKSGQVYITVKLRADNPSANDFFGYSYLRLKSGATVSSPTLGSSSSFPDEIKAGTTNNEGSQTFLVPTATSYTLIFEADPQNQISQATMVFNAPG